MIVRDNEYYLHVYRGPILLSEDQTTFTLLS
jgi:hypothetical protein